MIEGAAPEHPVRDLDQGIHPGHLVTAPSHRSRHLLLEATRGVTIAVVSSRERKRRQPGLATDDPAFVGWHQLVRGIQGSQVHFDFVRGAPENGRAAAGTEKPPGVVACFAIDRHRILREHRGSVKKGPMMLAAVETVTKANACPLPVLDAKARVLIGQRVVAGVLLPQQLQGDSGALELLVDPRVVGGELLARARQRRAVQPCFEFLVGQRLGHLPVHCHSPGQRHVLARNALGDLERAGDLVVAQSCLQVQAQCLSYSAHRDSVRWHGL